MDINRSRGLMEDATDAKEELRNELGRVLTDREARLTKVARCQDTAISNISDQVLNLGNAGHQA